MTTLERDVKNAERNEYTMRHYERLMEAMHGHPELYDWTGDILDMGEGHCACGHWIRWGFPLAHKENGDRVIVGCVCVEHYKIATTDVVDKMKEKIAEQLRIIEEKKREAKRIAQDEEIKKLVEERDTLYQVMHELFMSIRQKGEFVRHDMWEYATKAGRKINPENYVKKGSCIKSLKKEIEKLKDMNANPKPQTNISYKRW